MTRALSEDLNFYYTLLFTGESALKSKCHMKALLCFEDCRKSADELSAKDSVYLYCFFRALRKEAQILRLLGLAKRGYKILKKALPKLDEDWHSNEKLLVLLQLYDLSEEYEPLKRKEYFDKLNIESEAIRAGV